MINRFVFFLIFFVAYCATPLSARVSSVVIHKREKVLDGRSFGQYGSYEWIQGEIIFEFDRDNLYNSKIVDLKLAHLNNDGKIEARANFEVLQASDPLKRRGLALVEVSNRGSKFSMRYFNRAGTGKLDPGNQESFGDGLLMQMGLTVIWVGWEFDVPDESGLLRLEVPFAVNSDGTAITGLVRSDWTVDQSVKNLKLGHKRQISYPVYNKKSDKNVLTIRDGRETPRRIVPRKDWSFARETDGNIKESDTYIYMQKGFDEGKIYELVYEAKDPPVVGLGLAVIRDVLSYAKYNNSAVFPVRQGLAAGVSQTGRFLRHFIYQGFNTDEEGRKVYDGMMIITAGAGRGSFNHRFAQPSRDAHAYSAFFYPTDLFPFTGGNEVDWETGKPDGLFQHMFVPNQLPKIFYINTGYEYWGRAASLIHTNSEGDSDVNLLPNERIFHLASGQHFVGRRIAKVERVPGKVVSYRGNPLDFSVNYRALLFRLISWTADGKLPQISVCPSIEKQTLVSVDNVQFPAIPEIKTPHNNHVAYRVNYGDQWDKGIITNQPPVLGYPFPSLVCQLDESGNEMAGIRNIELRVPLATYFPWNLRTGFKGGSDQLTDFLGTFIPFPLTEEEKAAAGDPRPAILSLYPSKNDYMEKINSEISVLVDQGFVLPQDKVYLSGKASSLWDLITGNK